MELKDDERIDDLNVDDIQSELEKLNTAESLKTKKELFEILGNVCETIVSAREGLKGYDLTDNELAFLLHIINKINQSLLITNFSNKEIDLILKESSDIEFIIWSFKLSSFTKNKQLYL